MAEEITCPVCESSNDASLESCEECGADLLAAAEAPDVDEAQDAADPEDHFAAGYGFETEPSDAVEVDDEDDEPAYELEVDSEGEADDDFEYPTDDPVAADGGMPLDAEAQFAPVEDEADEHSEDEEFLAENAEESVAEEEPAAPPELEAILNPERVEHEPIEPLPRPGGYKEPANLRVFYNGEDLGALAIDSACTVLGVDDSAGDYDLEAVEEEAAFELEAISEPALEDDGEQDFAAENIAPDGAGSEDSGLEADSDASDAASEDDAQPDEPVVFEDPENLEEGPVIDLSQYGDASKFARRHGYIFRQNKNYTLYVLSDMGTQLNDEMLELGAHRKLAHGDVVILGGEVALQFRAPAS